MTDAALDAMVPPSIAHTGRWIGLQRVYTLGSTTLRYSSTHRRWWVPGYANGDTSREALTVYSFRADTAQARAALARLAAECP